MQITSQSEYLKYLNDWGFNINPLNKTIKGVKNLLKNYFEIEKEMKLIWILMELSIKSIIFNFKKIGQCCKCT